MSTVGYINSNFAVYLMLQLNASQHILWRLCIKWQSRKRLRLLCY